MRRENCSMKAMAHILHSHHPLRIFAFSGVLTVIILGGVVLGMGPQALFTAVILMLVELTFSFDNAIINAQILTKMSPFWRTMFMTVGIVIAVFGMRVVFPILLVMISAGLSPGSVIDLALHQPHKYSEILVAAHPIISGFGGMFLMMLALEYFLDRDKDLHWIVWIEKSLKRIGYWWVPTTLSLVVLIVVSYVPWNHHGMESFQAGIVGIMTFLVINALVSALERQERSKITSSKALRTGLAGFVSFLYLEILDASFSFDGVLGALAITQNVILIAAGLGIGALWIRSLTIFIVRRGTLETYRYLEHGAHYTIFLLSCVLLAGLFFEVPEYVPGLGGLLIIGLAVWSSISANRRTA